MVGKSWEILKRWMVYSIGKSQKKRMDEGWESPHDL
jgi:hypothetical protein